MNKVIYLLTLLQLPILSFGIVKQKSSCDNCNLIIISLSNARPKNMSLYGYQRETTPYLKQFFKDSFIFDNAIAPASLTFVDSLSFFYSLNPIKHQIFNRKKIKRNYDQITKYDPITTVLKKNGYKTAAFVSDEDYAYEWGMSKGFDLYFDKTKYADEGILYRPQSYNIGIKSLTRPAVNWLRKNKQSKFFLFLQGFDMHCPYGPNENFSKLYQSNHNPNIPFEEDCFMNREPLKAVHKKGIDYYPLSSFFAFKLNNQKDYLFTNDDLEYLKSRYDAELTKSDFYINQLLQQIASLDLIKNTVIVFMSEHGDNLGENNFFMKSNNYPEGNLHNANLKFALAIKIPNLKSINKAHGQIIQTIDVTPSILDLLKISPSSTMQGKSFIPILNTTNEINKYNYGYSVRLNIENVEDVASTLNQFEVIQDKTWKYYKSRTIRSSDKKTINTKEFLFNLKNDPSESNNLTNNHSSQLEIMKKELEVNKKYYY